MCNLNAPFFQDEDQARKYLEAQRWPDGPVCPHCGGTERIYPIKANKQKKVRKGLLHCNDCEQQFSVTVGTVFERSRVPLNKWLLATYLMCSSKKGVSAKQIERSLGVTYKTAWFMCHRIREAMRDGSPSPMGGFGSPVEVDETFWGGKKQRVNKKARGYGHKEKIMTLVERQGRARSFHVPEVNAKTLRPIMSEQIQRNTVVFTDEAAQYRTSAHRPIEQEFAHHATVNHAIGEYVRGDVHTNTIEGYFSILKRGMNGVYQHCSKEHLKRYLCEFDFRYNYREKLGYNDMERTNIALQGIEGKRLTYGLPDAQ